MVNINNPAEKFKYNKFGFFRKSVLASAIVAILAPTYSNAQDDDEDDIVEEEVLVQGVRSSLQSAQDIKREADTFVDAISAQDIGALPDRSVLEAMQRLPGVSIERFAAADDPDHVAPEGSGVVIRGLTQTRSEFNGRDSFGANAGGGLNFSDVPPELMAGVDLYKNQSADMIEGGIAGTVSLRTRKPFDSGDRILAFSADATWGDLAEETTPSFSALYSDRWDTDAGEFGFLFNIADSELTASSHGIQSDVYQLQLGWLVGLDPVSASTETYWGNFQNPGDGLWYPNAVIPNASNVIMKTDTRDRLGIASAVQWQSPDDSLLATVQYLRSDSDLSWNETSIKYQNGYTGFDTTPLDGTQWTFDENNTFVSGALTQDERTPFADGWRSNNAERVPQGANWSQNYMPQYGHQFQSDHRIVKENSLTEDLSLNLVWNPDNHWKLETDIQFIEASKDNNDMTAFLGLFALETYTRPASGNTPRLLIQEPYATIGEGAAYPNDPTPGDGEGGANSLTAEDIEQLWPLALNENYFTTPSSYYWRSNMDHIEGSVADSKAFRQDVTYFIDDSFFTKVQAGVRFADKEQTIKNTTYNWGHLAAPWAGALCHPRPPEGTPENECPDPSQNYPADASWLDLERAAWAGLGGDSAAVEVIDWGNFYRGGVLEIQGGNKMIHPSYALMNEFQNFGRIFPYASPINQQWQPLDQRDVLDENGIPYASDDQPRDGVVDTYEGPYLRSDISLSEEKTKSAFVRLDFGSDKHRFSFNGNIGLRFVQIDYGTSGYIQYPFLTPQNAAPEDAQDISDLAVREQMVEEFYDRYEAYYEQHNPDDGLGDDVADAEALADYTDDSLDWVSDEINFVDEELRAFANRADEEVVIKSTYSRLLPSFNLKVNLTDELLARFAFSRAIAKPDLADLRTSLVIGTLGDVEQYVYFPTIDPNSIPSANDDPNASGPDPIAVAEERARAAAYAARPGYYDNLPMEPRFTAAAIVNGWQSTAGNPLLRPMESDQFDLSLEWYFADVGSLTGSLFYKDLENFFVNGTSERYFTNPTSFVSQPVNVQQRVNAEDGKVQGFELAYQQFYDMLPEPFDGIGIQANYTYVDAVGVPNSNLNNGNGSLAITTIEFDELPLQGQSKDTANFVLMYSKGKIDARVAYNWRSEYLLTTSDVISTLPIYTDARGQVDASFTYSVTDALKVGVQGVNLNDSEIRTIMQVDGRNTRLGRSWFINDRRYSLFIRGQF